MTIFYIIGAVVCIVVSILLWGKGIKTKLDFKQSIALTGLPVVSFKNNGNWINLLLDTGSNRSILDERALKGLKYDEDDYVDEDPEFVGISGSSLSQKTIILYLEHDGSTYPARCYVMDLSATFDAIKSESGVTIHGILGTDFFDYYKYILDFNKLIAYSRKL